MNQNIKPLTVLALLAFFLAMLSGRYWAHGAAVSVRLFSHMHPHPNGDAYIMLGRQLYGFDRQGRSTGVIDLARFAVDEDAVTDFAFFSDGDLLIRRHIDEQGFIANLQRFYRFDNPQEAFSQNAKSGLFRCDPIGLGCQPFTSPNLNLNDAFWLAIDWDTDQVFIADTSRHTLYLYSKTGVRLDSVDGFHFPNQIHYQDKKLYVADTNHHRLDGISVSDGHFGSIVDTMDTRSVESIAKGEVWPAAFLLMDGKRWVHNAKANMVNGGIYLFEHGDAKRVALPEDADPFSLLRMGRVVLVSDYSQGRIYQLDADGKLLPEFQAEVFQTPLTELKKQKSLYHSLELLATGLFALGLAGGFGFAVLQQRRSTAPNRPAQKPVPVKIAADGTGIHWIKPKPMFKVLMGVVGLANVFLLPIIWLVCFIGGDDFGVFLKQNHSIFVLAFALGLVVLLQLRRKIGVAKGFVVIVPAWERASTCATEDIAYSDTLVLFGTVAIHSNHLMAVFPAEEVEQLLYPMIKRGRPVDMAEIRTVLWKQNTILALWLVAIAALIGLFLYFGFSQ